MNSATRPPKLAPDLRLRRCGRQEEKSGRYILYWMTASRRPRFNFGLDHAVALANQAGLPLVVLEALRLDYPHASDRLHRFVIEGMNDHRQDFDRPGVRYFPYVEPTKGAGKGLLKTLAQDASVVVTDDFPTFFLRRMVAAAASQIAGPLDVIDSNGWLPMASSEKTYLRAVDFRRFLQKTLPSHWNDRPSEDPLAALQSQDQVALNTIEDQWPEADIDALLADGGLSALAIDHSVSPALIFGGPNEARRRFDAFYETHLPLYADRNDPDADIGSTLSAFLHFGHISSHEIVETILDGEGFDPERTRPAARGQREGWWGLHSAIEGFLDQILTWRELGYHYTNRVPDHCDFSSLPEWAQITMAEHKADTREVVYSLDQLEGSKTHDEIWNAAQRQLVIEGRIHNYLRMLWGKKIYEWSSTPSEALERMILLNDRYALDGRNPNSYSGIGWVMGRFDRAWGPERPIYGKLRYMSSDNTRRKLRLKSYLERWKAR